MAIPTLGVGCVPTLLLTRGRSPTLYFVQPYPGTESLPKSQGFQGPILCRRPEHSPGIGPIFVCLDEFVARSWEMCRMIVSGGKWEIAKEALWLLTMHRVHRLGDSMAWTPGADSVPALPRQLRPSHFDYPSEVQRYILPESSTQFYVIPVVTKAPPPPKYGLVFVTLFFSLMRKGCSKSTYRPAIFKFDSKIWLLCFFHFAVFLKSRWLISTVWNGWWWWWSGQSLRFREQIQWLFIDEYFIPDLSDLMLLHIL